MTGNQKYLFQIIILYDLWGCVDAMLIKDKIFVFINFFSLSILNYLYQHQKVYFSKIIPLS